MSLILPDTPKLGQSWCPLCQPDRDPAREILETHYCGDHLPSLRGTADETVTLEPVRLSAGEAEGAACRAIAQLIR